MSRISNPCVNFRFIPFVSASENVTETTSISPQHLKTNLKGEEASLFYNKILSLPTASIPVQRNTKQQLVKPKRVMITAKQCNNRLTILHHAQEGNIEGIEYNISKGCDVDFQDMYGWTPLMCATFEGHYAVVEHLIKRGANLDLKNKQGQTALNFAVQRNNKALINLLNGGTSINAYNNKDKTKDEVKFCTLCNSLYSESLIAHETSIAHLLCCKKDADISTYYHIPENNKGFQIMLKKGWDKNKGLGVNSVGRKFPIKTTLKRDRTCIGGKKTVSKVTHFGPKDYDSVKIYNLSKERVIREKTKKGEMQKLWRKDRQKEINFRRQFNTEN